MVSDKIIMHTIAINPQERVKALDKRCDRLFQKLFDHCSTQKEIWINRIKAELAAKQPKITAGYSAKLDQIHQNIQADNESIARTCVNSKIKHRFDRLAHIQTHMKTRIMQDSVYRPEIDTTLKERIAEINKVAHERSYTLDRTFENEKFDLIKAAIRKGIDKPERHVMENFQAAHRNIERTRLHDLKTAYSTAGLNFENASHTLKHSPEQGM